MLPFDSVAQLLTENPLAATAIGAVVVRAALAWQRQLSWPEYRTAHGLKRWVFPLLQRRAPVISWVNDKGGRTDAEYLDTLDADVRAIAGRLTDAGGNLHLLASVKRRPTDHGDALSLAHVVFLHDDGTQTEAYLFRNDDGTTDAYSHHEPDPARLLAHLGGDNQSDGDPRGVVTEALAQDGSLGPWLGDA